MAGIPTIVARYEMVSELRFSKYVGEFLSVPHPQKREKRCLETLIALSESRKIRPALFYGDDVKLAFLSRNRDALHDYYRLSLPDHDLLEAFLNKNQFIELSRERDLPAPRSIAAEHLAQPEDIVNHLEFPIFIKPNLKKDWRDSHWRKFLRDRPHKGFVCVDLEELKAIWQAVGGISTDFIVQEFIPGDDSGIVSYHSYVGRNGEVHGAFAGKKIRTYPRLSGGSTYLELVHDRKIFDAGEDVLKKLNMRGISKIDFKRDARTGKLYILEINARYNLWNYLGAANGVSLPEVAYRDLYDMPIVKQFEYKTRYNWISVENDIRALKEYHKHDEWSIPQWIASLIKPKVYNYFSWSDPMPFVVKVGGFFTKVLKRPGKSSKTAEKSAEKVFDASISNPPIEKIEATNHSEAA